MAFKLIAALILKSYLVIMIKIYFHSLLLRIQYFSKSHLCMLLTSGIVSIYFDFSFKSSVPGINRREDLTINERPKQYRNELTECKHKIIKIYKI